MAELRLLIVGLSWPPETFLRRLIYGLADAGFEITLAGTSRPGRLEPAHPNLSWLPLRSWHGPPVARLAGLAASTIAAFSRAPRTAARLLAQHLGSPREGMPSWNRLAPFVGRCWDVVYFPWNTGAIDYSPAFEPALGIEVPRVVSCRGAQVNIAPHNPERASIREGLRATFQQAAAVHCVSRAIAREAEIYGLDPAKVRLIQPAVDTELFSPAESPPPEGDLRIVTTGGLVWRKGHEYALMSLRELLNRGVEARFDVIGDGPERQRLLFTVQDLELGSRVRLLGKLPPEQVRDRLRRSHVFLLSSLSEGISNAVLEAMACGLPVVTTDCGGMREAVTDSENGRVVPVREPVAAAQALAQLAASRPLREQLGSAARRTVMSRFDLPSQIESYAEMFRSVAASKKGTP